jgi:S1-C subfamily serine protease
MSDAGPPRRLPLIATGFAAVALVFAVVAVIVVLGRSDEPQKSAPAKPAIAPVTDHTVPANDVVKIERSVEMVVEAGTTKGARFKDADLAKVFGLEAEDLIIAVSGRPITRSGDLHDVIFNSSMMNATTLYVEAMRGETPMLLRWRLDGDLREARYGSTAFGSYPSYTPPAPDPLLDTIEKVDDTHTKIPRATVDKILADPMSVAKGARVVPSVKNGQPNGLKLYAIRPSSVYARLGFSNGDTVEAVNGFEITTADKALEIYTKLKDADDLVVQITRRGKPIQLTITITK